MDYRAQLTYVDSVRSNIDSFADSYFNQLSIDHDKEHGVPLYVGMGISVDAGMLAELLRLAHIGRQAARAKKSAR